MKRADVVILTDGEDELEPGTVDIAQELTRAEGVSWFVVGVGHEAEQCARTLGPIATSIIKVRDTGDAEVLVLVVNHDPAA